MFYDCVVLRFSFVYCVFFFFKQKTAYEMRISDWSSDVCSSDLPTLGSRVRWNDELMNRWKRMRSIRLVVNEAIEPLRSQKIIRSSLEADVDLSLQAQAYAWFDEVLFAEVAIVARVSAHGDYDHPGDIPATVAIRSEEPTSEL